MDGQIYANHLALSRYFLIENLQDALKQLANGENKIIFCVGNVEVIYDFKDTDITISV